MEQRAVIRFFTLKGLSPRDIHTELESVYRDEPSVSARSTNGTSGSCKGERSCLIIRGLDDPCKMILAMPFVVCFKNSHSLHARFSVYTSESQRLLSCASCTMFSIRKSSIYARSRILSMTLKNPNGYHFQQTL
jgi:hypothetical protein